MSRIIIWSSRGAASAVAGILTNKKNPECLFVCCDTGSEHADSDRFENDISRVVNKKFIHIKSSKYFDTWDVWTSRSYLAGISGAPCTGELKIKPRLEFQLPGDIHVFGYTADKSDIIRAERLKLNFPKLKILTPLIDMGLKKSHVLHMIKNMGIDLPLPYRLGFKNNNCIPCVKATSPNYWSLVRKEFPNKFFRLAKLSRKLNVKLSRIKGKRIFIDEIPPNWPTDDPVVPTCDFLCGLAEMGLAENN